MDFRGHRGPGNPRVTATLSGMNEVDVANVEPLTSVVTMKMKMRTDEVTDGNYPQKIVANAPAQEDDFFMVPKVVE